MISVLTIGIFANKSKLTQLSTNYINISWVKTTNIFTKTCYTMNSGTTITEVCSGYTLTPWLSSSISCPISYWRAVKRASTPMATRTSLAAMMASRFAWLYWPLGVTVHKLGAMLYIYDNWISPTQLNVQHLADNICTHIPCLLVRLVSCLQGRLHDIYLADIRYRKLRPTYPQRAASLWTWRNHVTQPIEQYLVQTTAAELACKGITEGCCVTECPGNPFTTTGN